MLNLSNSKLKLLEKYIDSKITKTNLIAFLVNEKEKPKLNMSVQELADHAIRVIKNKKEVKTVEERIIKKAKSQKKVTNFESNKKRKLDHILTIDLTDDVCPMDCD